MRVTQRGIAHDVFVAALGCFLGAGALCAAGVRAAENVASNLDLMERLTGEVVDELRGQFAGTLGTRTVLIKPFASTEDYIFVGNVMTGRLTNAGIRTTVATVAAPAAPAAGAGDVALPQSGVADAGPAPAEPLPDVAEAAYTLKFQNTAFALNYTDVYRSHMVGGKRVKREAAVRVLATLVDATTGQVVWTGEAERTHADEFSRGDANRVEQGTYQFVRPAMPSGGLARYAEPVFVTGIIVGLIYLFFSNQSDE